MATLAINIPAFTATSNTQTALEETIQFVPPANVSGKLCRLSVSECVIDGNYSSSIPILVSCDIPQPHGVNHMLSASTLESTTISRNKIICCRYNNTPNTGSDKPIIVQISDGPMAVKFRFESLLGTALTTDDSPKELPTIFLMIQLTPVDRNNHFEKLESFSTGPNVRM